MTTQLAAALACGVFIQVDGVCQTTVAPPPDCPPRTFDVAAFKVGDLVSVQCSKRPIILGKARIVSITTTNVRLATKTDAFTFKLSDLLIMEPSQAMEAPDTGGEGGLAAPNRSTTTPMDDAGTVPGSAIRGSAGVGSAAELEPSPYYSPTSWIGGGYPAPSPAVGSGSANTSRLANQPSSKPAPAGKMPSILAVGQPNTAIGQPNVSIGQPNVSAGKSNLGPGVSNLGIGKPNQSVGQPNTTIKNP